MSLIHWKFLSLTKYSIEGYRLSRVHCQKSIQLKEKIIWHAINKVKYLVKEKSGKNKKKAQIIPTFV